MASPAPESSADAEIAAWSAGERQRRRRLLIGAGLLAVVAVGLTTLLYLQNRAVDFPEIDKPFLWEVTGPGKTSYVFGTLHVGYGLQDLPEVVLDAQARTSVTVLESNLLSTSKGPKPARPDRLTPAEWKALSAMSGMAIPKLHRVGSLQLSGVVLLASVDRKREPMDRAFQTRASKLGKRLEFLMQPTAPGQQSWEPIPEPEALS